MLRLAFSDLNDWRLRSIRFKTELTNPALCPLADLGELTIETPASIANKRLRGTNLFIKTPHCFKRTSKSYPSNSKVFAGGSKNPAIIRDD
jgi:hypothetical protein